MEEIWKPVNIEDGYEKLYLVSNLGRVKGIQSKKILKGRSNGKGKGYFKVALYKNKKGKNFYIHRIVAFAFLPVIPGKDEVNHLDGNPNNNVLENLEWCSRQDNMRHAVENNLYSDKYNLLENRQMIQDLMRQGQSYEQIGKMFGCHPSYVNAFALREDLELPYKRRKVFTKSHLEKAHTLLLDGLNYREIGLTLNFANSTIASQLKQHYGKDYVNRIRYEQT